MRAARISTSLRPAAHAGFRVAPLVRSKPQHRLVRRAAGVVQDLTAEEGVVLSLAALEGFLLEQESTVVVDFYTSW